VGGAGLNRAARGNLSRIRIVRGAHRMRRGDNRGRPARGARGRVIRTNNE